MAENPNVTVTDDGTPLEEIVVTGNRPLNVYYDPYYMMGQSFLQSAKFMVRIPTIPLFAINRSQISEREFTFLCDSVEFPGQTLTTSDYRIPGRQKIKVPYMRDPSEVTLTFYHNVNFPVYQIFSDWLEGVSPTTDQNEYFDDVVCDITIVQFKDGSNFLDWSKEQNGIKLLSNFFDRQTYNNFTLKQHMRTDLKRAYPTSFTSMPSNWADDGFHKMTVTFFFEKVTTTTIGYTNEADYYNNDPDGKERYDEIFQSNVFG